MCGPVCSPPRARAETIAGTSSSGASKPSRASRMPDSVDGKIGSQNERREARLERLTDHLVAHLTVAEDVDLEPARRARCGGCNVCGRCRRNRRKTHERAGLRSAPCRAGLALLVRNSLKGCRRDHHGHRDRCSQYRVSPSRPMRRRRALAGAGGSGKTTRGSSAAFARRQLHPRCRPRPRAAERSRRDARRRRL